MTLPTDIDSTCYRLRLVYGTGFADGVYPPNDPQSWWQTQDERAVVTQYLADNDPTPLDAAYVIACGFFSSAAYDDTYYRDDLYVEVGERKSVPFFIAGRATPKYLSDIRTRGEFHNVCKVCGVSLKQPEPVELKACDL